MPDPYVIAEPCVGVKDRACVNACPVNCIYETPDQLVIHPGECIGCNACVDPCPVEAIFQIDDVPEKWNSYIAKNADWFKSGGPRSPAVPRSSA